MSSPFTDRERLDWLADQKYLCYGTNYINGRWIVQVEEGGNASHGANLREAIDAAMLSAGLTPEPRETETELDAKRFAHYLVGNRAFRDNSIIKMEMRAVSGDDPTLDEWRAAIDKSILAAAKHKELVED